MNGKSIFLTQSIGVSYRNRLNRFSRPLKSITSVATDSDNRHKMTFTLSLR